LSLPRSAGSSSFWVLAPLPSRCFDHLRLASDQEWSLLIFSFFFSRFPFNVEEPSHGRCSGLMIFMNSRVLDLPTSFFQFPFSCQSVDFCFSLSPWQVECGRQAFFDPCLNSPSSFVDPIPSRASTYGYILPPGCGT